MLDKEYWNDRYRSNRMGWNIGYPSTPLKSYMDNWGNKEAAILIPGAGNAYEAEYLHQQGFSHVYVMDWSQLALDGFRERVPAFPVDHLLLEDFFDHKGQYDLILEQTFFCAIDPSLRANYARHMYHNLKPGGLLVGVLFDVPLNEDKPPFGGHHTEYEALFAPFFRFNSFGPCENSIPERAGSEWFIELEKPIMSHN